MSYEVFARKYRPQTFDDVVAQEHITRTLRNAVTHDRLAAGYLFCGPRGTGKTTVARILAKAVNCLQGPTATPCGACDPCKEIARGVSMDVLEIDAASNTGVDDIRALRENIRYLPSGGKKRIYIIDEVHRLSGSAFDALLKTLEEPPPHAMFVFATTEPLKVPETILSRTQRFDFRRVSIDELARHLGRIAKQERLTVSDPALRLVARKADGSVRDALSLLDQVVAFAGITIDEREVVETLGLVDRRILTEFVAAAGSSDRKQALRVTTRVIENGTDVGDFAEELLEHLRILLVLRSDPDSGQSLALTPEDLAEYQQQVEIFPVGDILRLMQIVIDLNGALKSGLDERLLLEVAAIKMSSMDSIVNLAEILDRLNALPSGSSGGAAPTSPSAKPELFNDQTASRPAAPPARRLATAPAVPPQPGWPNRPLSLAQVQAGWDGFLNAFRQNYAMLAAQLRMAELTSVKDNVIQLTFFSAGEASRQLVQKPESTQAIINGLRDYFRSNLMVRFDIDRSKEYAAGHTEPAENRVDPAKLVAESPRLKSLLNKVDGEIIGIKKVEQ